MFRIDEEIVRQRMMELRQEAREFEKARRHCNGMKRKKRKSVLKTIMIFFKK